TAMLNKPLRGRSMRPLFAFLFAIFLFILPAMCLAAEGDVKLNFKPEDKVYLWVSLGFALLSIAVGAIISSTIMKLSAGNDNMKRVQRAIHDGAFAYLQKQVKTMSVMVIVLGAGLYFLYQGDPNYGPTMAIWLVVCFIAGVAASY